MATITVGNKTLTIPQAVVAKCAGYLKKWYGLPGDTPQEILDAWSQHEIDELKNYLVSCIGQTAWDGSMEGSKEEAEEAKDTAELQADEELVIS